MSFVREAVHNSLDAGGTVVRMDLLGKKIPPPKAGASKTLASARYDWCVFLTITDNGNGMDAGNFARKISILSETHVEMASTEMRAEHHIGMWGAGLRAAASQMAKETWVVSVCAENTNILSISVLSRELSEECQQTGDQMRIPVGSYNRETKESTGDFLLAVRYLLESEFDGAQRISGKEHGGYLGEKYDTKGREYFQHPLDDRHPDGFMIGTWSPAVCASFVERTFLEDRSRPTYIGDGGTCVIMARLTTPMIAVVRPAQNVAVVPTLQQEGEDVQEGIMIPRAFAHMGKSPNKTPAHYDRSKEQANLTFIGGSVELYSAMSWLLAPRPMRSPTSETPNIVVQGVEVDCDTGFWAVGLHQKSPTDISEKVLLKMFPGITPEKLAAMLRCIRITAMSGFPSSERCVRDERQMFGFVPSFNSCILGHFRTYLPEETHKIITDRQHASGMDGPGTGRERELCGLGSITIIDVSLMMPTAMVEKQFPELKQFRPEKFKTGFCSRTVDVVDILMQCGGEVLRAFIEAGKNLPADARHNTYDADVKKQQERKRKREVERQIRETGALQSGAERLEHHLQVRTRIDPPPEIIISRGEGRRVSRMPNRGIERLVSAPRPARSSAGRSRQRSGATSPNRTSAGNALQQPVERVETLIMELEDFIYPAVPASDVPDPESELATEMIVEWMETTLAAYRRRRQQAQEESAAMQ